MQDAQKKAAAAKKRQRKQAEGDQKSTDKAKRAKVGGHMQPITFVQLCTSSPVSCGCVVCLRVACPHLGAACCCVYVLPRIAAAKD